MTLRELYRQIINTSVRSALVTGIEPILLEEPVLKLRAHLGALAFIEVFFNEETGKTSFALIKNSQRLFGADNTRGWYLHPFDSPESHGPCEERRILRTWRRGHYRGDPHEERKRENRLCTSLPLRLDQ